MVRYKYNEQLNPPAPFVHVSIMVPDQPEVEKRLPAQLDTAADHTVIPLALVDDLHLERVRELLIAGLGGTTARLLTFLVRLRVHAFEPLMLEVVGADEPIVLLGRDVLNRYRLLLDGPARALEVE